MNTALVRRWHLVWNRRPLTDVEVAGVGDAVGEADSIALEPVQQWRNSAADRLSMRQWFMARRARPDGSARARPEKARP
jgi:hypothetical protein